MILFQQVGMGLLLVLLTVSLLCAGVGALIIWLRSVSAVDIHELKIFHSASIVMQLSMAVILLHGVIILFWAGSYRWLCFPSWESAFYFSASSYTTVGYGDVFLPSKWRLLGPLESMVGMLMSGVTVGLLFATMSQLAEGRSASRLPNRSEPAETDQ